MKSKKITKETILQLGVAERSFPEFRVGDTIKVNQRVKEGEKERVQAFEGDVIASRNNGVGSTFVVRKIGANGIAVERIYPYHCPIIDSIELVKKGKVRRAQAYYVRDRVGKSARFKELILTREQKEQKAAQKAQ